MVWKPHVTVAAVIEQDRHFLLVEEQTSQGLAFNQPAGHLEANEDLVSAIVREVQEETAWIFEAEYLIGVQLWRRSTDFPTFLRFCFAGQVHSHNPNQTLDDDIVNTHWLTRDQLSRKNLRSPLVLKSIDEFLQGERYPLSMLKSFIDLA